MPLSARQLKDGWCRMTSSSDLETSEREKYEAVWAHAPYREQSDGEPACAWAVRTMACQEGDTIIDWGCGKGICTDLLQRMGLKATGFDIAPNCLDHDLAKIIPLVVGTMWNPPAGLAAMYGFCTDVLEHIPPEHLKSVLDVLVARSSIACFIQLDTFPDLSGPRMKPPRTLHLSLHSPQWWKRELEARWRVVSMSSGLYTRWRYVCLK